MNQQQSVRILNFLTYLQRNNFYGGFIWFEGEYHGNVALDNGQKISYHQGYCVDIVLDSIINDLRKVGL